MPTSVHLFICLSFTILTQRLLRFSITFFTAFIRYQAHYIFKGASRSSLAVIAVIDEFLCMVPAAFIGYNHTQMVQGQQDDPLNLRYLGRQCLVLCIRSH